MDFLSLAELSRQQIVDIVAMAEGYRENPTGSDLSGKTAVLFFPESSIRTRIAFEKAICDLGGHPILFPPSALDKREEMRDVAGYMNNWIDIAIVRHPDIERIRSLAGHARFPVVNAMTAQNHPCEILSDYFSFRTGARDADTLRLTFVGPDGNILRSWLNLAGTMGLKVVHVCREGERIAEDSAHYEFTTELEPVLPESDVILTDSLPREYQTPSYIDEYRITERHLMMLPDNAVVNPCPPFTRGDEIDAGIPDSPAFVGYEFKKNLLYVHQAIIRYCLET